MSVRHPLGLQLPDRLGVEIRAGATTFLTMAYILAVNPSILSDAGMPAGDVAIATALASAVACLVMGLWAKLPIALAPGMGLNAYFAYTVVLGMGVPWQWALLAVFVEGLLFMLLALANVRSAIVGAIPRSMKKAITVGIGLFLAVIALTKVGIVSANEATIVGLGDLTRAEPLLALGGIVLTAALVGGRVPGAILAGIVALTAVAWMFQLAPGPESVVELPRLPRETFLAFTNVEAISLAVLVPVVFAFLFVDLFDTAGTLIGVTDGTGLLSEKDRGRTERAFFADAVGTTAGALLGTSTVTSYIESRAGIEEGGRTGLTAVTAAVLFLAALFFTPLFVAIPGVATAPALVVIGSMMMKGVGDIEWGDAGHAVPAILCILIMPLTFSIANGIGIAVLSHVLIQLIRGKWRSVNPILAVLAVLVPFFYLAVH